MHHRSSYDLPAQYLLSTVHAVGIALALFWGWDQTSAAGQNAPSLPAQQAGRQIRRFEPIKAKLRLQGTSNIDDWQVECSWIGGFLEVGPSFPDSSTRLVTSTGNEPRAEAEVGVLGLKSVERDGKPFSNKMDEIMYAKLNAPTHPRILYRLLTMHLRAGAQSSVPYLFETQGELVVGGVTNVISMPINVLPLEGNRLKISGTASFLMTDFHIEPPAPKIALGLIKTGNEVKLAFDWLLVQKEAPPISAN